MTVIAFDTLKFSKRLTEAGFTEQQAEALAAAEAEFIEENLVAKRDLKETEAALTRDIKETGATLSKNIKELETRLIRDMRELEYRMTIKLGAMLVIAAGVMATLTKIL